MSRKILCVLLFAVAPLFVSCKTAAFYIPGEKSMRVKNLYVEYYNLAEEFYSLKKYDKAIQYYKLATAYKEVRVSAFYKLGLCYALNKNWTESEAIFSRLLKRDSKNVTLLCDYAYVLAQSSQFEQAEQVYISILASNPDLHKIRVNYITVLMADKKFSSAKTELDLLKQKNPDVEEIKNLEKQLAEEFEKLEDDPKQKNKQL